MQILHLDLKPVAENYAELRYFFDNANQYQRRSLPLEAIAEVIELAETAYYSPHESIILRSRLSVDNYTITGCKLFNWLDGSDRFLQQAINQYWREGLVLAIAAAESLAHLPWEVLHDGNSFLVARMPAIVPVRWVSNVGARQGKGGAKYSGGDSGTFGSRSGGIAGASFGRGAAGTDR